jgi:CMP-N-acetylneuraminic acid synthetase
MNKQPKVLAVILARGGSKAIPKKNIKKLADHPLIAYTICEALRSKKIDRVIVSTDDPEIQKVSIKYGAEAPFKRPKSLSGDKAKPVECILHATKWAEKDSGYNYDYVVELLCTNPFKTVKHKVLMQILRMKTNYQKWSKPIISIVPSGTILVWIVSKQAIVL